MSPRTRAQLVEAGLSLATMAVLLLALRYGPDLLAGARARIEVRRAGPRPVAEDEIAVAEFRAGMAGTGWAATPTGWEHE